MQPDFPESLDQSHPVSRTESEFSRDSQYYAQQLIDVLQKRNRFMGGMLALMLVVTIVAAFSAFKFYLDHQSAVQNVSSLQSEEGELQQTANALQQQLDDLQLRHNELAATASLTEKQLDASSSKLQTTDQMVEALKTNLDLVKAQNEQLQHENTIIRSALDTTASGKETTLALIDDKERAMKKQMEKLTFNQKQNAELKKEVANRKSAFDALSKRYQNIKGDIYSLEQTLNQSNDQLVNKNKEIKRLQAQAVEQKKEIKRFKTEYESLKASLQRATQPVISTAIPSNTVVSPNTVASPNTVVSPNTVISPNTKALNNEDDNGSDAEQERKVAPLTSGNSNTLDIPDQIILDLN